MPLVLQRYSVWLGTDPADAIEHTVTIHNADHLRAELEGHAHGLTKMSASPMHYAALWVWASMVRTGVYEKKFADFKVDCLSLEPIEDDEDDEDDDDDAGAAVDPIRAVPDTR